MTEHIFTIQPDKSLVEMHEERFTTEDEFQDLLGRYPSLLAGAQVNSERPRRWLLVKREMGIASEKDPTDRWSLDHLFLDQEAIPTLVEVKRSTDTRIRREVVGQVLDYAANAVVHWSIDQICDAYASTCIEDGVNPDDRLFEFLENESTIDDFWAKAKTNLQAGKIRMLFVADVIPKELRRIIEFLNEQMDPAEVLGIELRHFVGHDVKTLVPRVIGQTAAAELKKAAGSPGSRLPNLTQEQLQQIAEGKGTESTYRSLVQKLSAIFSRSSTSKSTISFLARVSDARNGSVFSLEPGDSSPVEGIRFYAYLRRISELAKLEQEDVLRLLPPSELDDPEWGGGRYRGYTSEQGLDEILERIREHSVH